MQISTIIFSFLPGFSFSGPVMYPKEFLYCRDIIDFEENLDALDLKHVYLSY